MDNRSYILLLQEEIKRYLRYNKINHFVVPKMKIHMAVQKIHAYALQNKQNLRYLLYSYAYFYVEVFKQISFAQVYLKVEEFLNKLDLETFKIIITDTDVDLAPELEQVWLKMNSFNINTLPLTVRKMLSQHRATIGVNTGFRYSRNMLCYARVANFINENRTRYPQLHGYEEFFAHLPAIRGSGEYRIEAYYNPVITLEKYYDHIYNPPNADRLAKWVETIPYSQLDSLKTSNMWGAPYVGELK